MTGGREGESRFREAEQEHARRFTELRPLLFSVAYEILGSATEADDVLQDSYLRWATVDLTDVDNSKAYLAKIVTRQSLNALRARARRREDYVGPWLPEPILLSSDDPSADVELAESVSTAMLLVLETLTPDERAVFVLREVFGFDHAEIAVIIDKSTAAVRQTAHRAREHVQARRRRFEPVDTARASKLTTAFFTAAATGDLEGLMAMLSPDVVYTADSNGKATAARRPIVGAEAVANLMMRMGSIGKRHGYRFDTGLFNSSPGVVFYSEEEVQGIFVVEISDGSITGIYVMRNPDKLVGTRTVRRIGR